ncbi:hypothetical protein STCU_01889 [Strigomonas culicis]|uniref:Uncharacterized protein n=1 Tax=Strigomonas culicis TaxID=28005 RepID=S9USE5_9TRYP|nr:hypothetical protein STCU_01889 [Strigomonas culicis]|eukprot:EPY33877.1 hypothetical protein STCU_01889 [Strigomonas culicis]
MHERYSAAVEAEEAERTQPPPRQAASPPPDAAAYHAYRQRAVDEGGASAAAGITWALDEPAPPHRFRALPPPVQLAYILRRLTMAERHIHYAADYGSLRMMAQLHLGEQWLTECEALLRQLGWWNDELGERVAALRDAATRLKYDYDLD